MSNNLAADLTVTGSDQLIVIGVAVIAVVALVIAFVLRAGVLAAGQGTPKMQEISEAVQEGAAAYLGRQFRTLAIFVVIVFVLLFVLPATTTSERIGRSIFFRVGALFSATIGYIGMWLATRANVRVAAAANGEGRERAMQIAFRTGGTVGLATTGLGLLGASVVVLAYAGGAPKVLEGFGFGAALLGDGGGPDAIANHGQECTDEHSIGDHHQDAEQPHGAHMRNEGGILHQGDRVIGGHSAQIAIERIGQWC